GTILGSFGSSQRNAYAAFADVTSLVTAGKSGTYATANVQADQKNNDLYAGGALGVGFGSPSEPARNLVGFDGFGEVANGNTVTATVAGFQTPPTGTVKIKLGAITFEGDEGLQGDSFRLDGNSLSDAANPANNFFNGSISELGANVTTRNPTFT